MSRARTARRAVVALAFVGVFLTVGVPRWLAGDAAPARSNAGAGGFAKLCREHGGTPAGERCTVRYGGRTYLMDAITPSGFDADTAHYQHQGCEEAERRRQASAHDNVRFVYHPATGVCEHRTDRRRTGETGSALRTLYSATS